MYARSDTVQMFTDNLRDLINHSYLGNHLMKVQVVATQDRISNLGKNLTIMGLPVGCSSKSFVPTTINQ